MADNDLKDILVDGDEGSPDVKDAVARATARLKQELTSKEREAAELKNQYQRIAKIASDRDFEAQKAQSELHKLAGYAVHTEHAALANALAAVEAEANTAQADLALAIETANGKQAADLQRKLSQLEARKLALEQGKDQIEAQIEQAKTAAPPPAPVRREAAPPTTGDAYEAMIAQSQIPEVQKQWLRKHKDRQYVAPGKNPDPKMLAAYYAAQAAGLREDSPAFVAHMDRVLGHAGMQQKQQQAPQDASERFAEQAPASQQQSAAKRPVPAAPPSRDTASNGGGRGASFRLSSEQRQTAQRLGMSDAEYVKGLQEGIRRGKLQASVLQQA